MDFSPVKAYAEETGLALFDYAVVTEEGVFEWESGKGNPCNNSYSVAKAFTATAIGLLFDEGKINVNTPVTEILKEESKVLSSDKWNKVLVKHALLHTMGISAGCLDIDTEDIFSYGTDDFLKVLFSKEIVYEPGEKEVYSDGAYYLLSRIVEKIAGERTDAYLMRKLLLPMGVREAAFSLCPKNHTVGATGLYIRAGDMAKLGFLYANGGVWQGKRLLSEEWVKAELENGYAFRPTEVKGIYAKGGMLGQMLLYSPEKKFAAAWHSYSPEGKVKGLTKVTKEIYDTYGGK